MISPCGSESSQETPENHKEIKCSRTHSRYPGHPALFCTPHPHICLACKHYGRLREDISYRFGTNQYPRYVTPYLAHTAKAAMQTVRVGASPAHRAHTCAKQYSRAKKNTQPFTPEPRDAPLSPEPLPPAHPRCQATDGR